MKKKIDGGGRTERGQSRVRSLIKRKKKNDLSRRVWDNAASIADQGGREEKKPNSFRDGRSSEVSSPWRETLLDDAWAAGMGTVDVEEEP